MCLQQAARQSVVNVTSLVDARGGPLGLNPLQVPQGTGSGFLWDSAGHVVTNWHVSMLFPIMLLSVASHILYPGVCALSFCLTKQCAACERRFLCRFHSWSTFNHSSHFFAACMHCLWLSIRGCACVAQVIRNAKAARVTLWNNKTYDATLRGVEPDKDLAVLKIQNPGNEPLRPVGVGSSSGLQVGQRVFAIGKLSRSDPCTVAPWTMHDPLHVVTCSQYFLCVQSKPDIESFCCAGNPFGLDQTLTGGLVSAVGREIRGVTGAHLLPTEMLY